MLRKLCVLFVCLAFTTVALCASMFGQDSPTQALKLKLRYVEPIAHGDPAARALAIQSGAATSLLPVWNFQAISTRDGNIYAGSMVGANPTLRGPDVNVSVTGQVVPIILKLHTIGTNSTRRRG